MANLFRDDMNTTHVAKQVWGFHFITVEVSEKEISCQLMFLIQNLTWRD
jgi:hypothetical protein